MPIYYFILLLFNLVFVLKHDLHAYTHFVSSSARGLNVGSSWNDAFIDLQSALAAADSGDEIWVVQGTYHSTNGTDSTSTFQMAVGVGVYGGFAGAEATREQRDWKTNKTILSGNIGSKDDSTDNSWHIVRGANGAVLDGFVVTGAHSPTSEGGGMYNSNASPIIRNCVFENNSSVGFGGGMYNTNASPTITNCIFINNTSSQGGGIYNSNSSPTLSNCLVVNNRAGSTGGGISNHASSSLTISNCTIANNISAGYGGGLYNDNSSAVITNCIIWGNTKLNQPEIFNSSKASLPTITYSCIRYYDGAGRKGNSNRDPGFIDAANGNLRLKRSSACIDAANGKAAPQHDLEGKSRFDDPGVKNIGVGTPNYVDIGAYENQLPTNITPMISGYKGPKAYEDDTLFFSISMLAVKDDNSFPKDFGLIVKQGSLDTLVTVVKKNDTLYGIIPVADYYGTVTLPIFVYDLEDTSDRYRLKLDVESVNDVPEITSIPLDQGLEDMRYSYKITASDKEGDPLRYFLTQAPDSMRIDSVTGLVTWTPMNADVGVETVKVKVTDKQGGEVRQFFTIKVINENDAPVITSSKLPAAYEDKPYTFTVLAKDADTDKKDLTYTLITSPKTMKVNPSSGTISWLPGAANVGIATIKVKVEDNNGGEAVRIFQLTVKDVNDAPLITSKPEKNAVEDVRYMYQVAASDEDKDALHYSLVQAPTGMKIDSVKGTIIWMPENKHVGVRSIQVKVSDGKGGTAAQKFKLKIRNANDPPEIGSKPGTKAVEDKRYEYRVKARDADPGDILSYALLTAPTGMKINPRTGILQWTPRNEHVGAESVSIKVQDTQKGIAVQSFSISVTNINDVPVITSTPETIGYEDKVYQYRIESNDVDKGDSVTYALLTGPSKLKLDPHSGMLSWKPTQKDVGTKKVKVKAVDKYGGEAHQEYKITIHDVNDAPVVTSTPQTTVKEDARYTYTLTATDEENDRLTFSLLQSPKEMTLNPSKGLLQWVPQNSDVGVETVRVEVSDTKKGREQQTFVITVINTNDAPSITSTPVIETYEDSVYVYKGRAKDDDPDDTIRYSLLAGADNMDLNAFTGTLTWKVRAQDVGTVAVKIQAADMNKAVDTQEFSITVYHVNHNPSSPMPVSPSDKIQLDKECVLIWSPATDKDEGDIISYRLEVSSKETFIRPEIVESNLQKTLILLKDLKQAKKFDDFNRYYWRIRAEDNQKGASKYSPTRSFVFTGDPFVRDNVYAYDNPTISNRNSGGRITLSCYVDYSQIITISAFDIHGNKVKDLAEKKFPQGKFTTQLVNPLPPGTYILRLDGKSFSFDRSITITR